ncbi:hypothetical protein CLU79DRAFT_837204 [Phycomyces nitens]|nr:hypothetical protein CLU79DRAFT_837204 [Phycomyces nitens]
MKQIALLLGLLFVQGIQASFYKEWVAPTLGDPFVPYGAPYGYDTGIPVENLTALARVPLEGNATAVFIFKPTGDTISYDFYLEGFNYKNACISWTVGVNYVVDYRPGRCYYNDNIMCISPMERGQCIFGVREPSQCGSAIEVSGISINETVTNARTLVRSGNSTVASLTATNKYNIGKRSILVSYTLDGQITPTYSCANFELGTGTIDSFITSGTVSSITSISKASFIFVLLFAILFY